MLNTKVKIFKDAVHGYINVPEYFVKYLIDDDYFQRLRNIEQTGMRVLYPAAKHDRFSHSLGVFHLGQKAVEALKKDSCVDIFGEQYERYEVLFLVACLLHDIGHTPFSHSLEEQILVNSKITEHIKGKRRKDEPTRTINEQLIKNINERELPYCSEENIEHEQVDLIKAAPHEQLGSYLIFEEFSEKIKLLEESCGIWKNDIVFDDDLCFIVRMIMGIKYKEWDASRQARNCFIVLLNGDNFDVDKLDYIVRDTQMSGINNVSVDVERLLGSLCVVTKTRHLNKVSLSKTNIRNLTISEIKKDDSANEFNIDGDFKGVIKVLNGAELTIGKNSKIAVFKGANQELAEIHYMSSDPARFTAKTKLRQDEFWIKEDDDGHKEKSLTGKPNKGKFGVYFENAVLLSELKIKADQDIEIAFFGQCSLKIKGGFESQNSLKLFSLNKLEGTISNVEIIGNTFKEDFTETKFASKNGYNTFSIGFRKQAINVIANVLEARNYLYLWVYAHHKVIYYANFLIPVISKGIMKYCGKNDFPCWELNFDNLDKLDDYYIWTAIKYIHSQASQLKTFKIKKEYISLIDQLFSRSYNRSLYKSLAEFELVFDSFTTEQKFNALKKLRDKTDSTKPFLGIKKQFEAGYLKSESINRINENIKEIMLEEDIPVEENQFELSEVLYVVTEFKQKTLDPNKVYLDMSDEILPISQLPLLTKNHIANNANKEKYFYLYYKDGIEAKSPERVRIIKGAIKKYLSN